MTDLLYYLHYIGKMERLGLQCPTGSLSNKVLTNNNQNIIHMMYLKKYK